jgi:Spy/CpxP family protein refolding chaperone
MCAVIQADKSTETAVQAMAGKVAALEADLAVGRMALYAGAAPILTDAQKQQLAGIE